jgi:hypothetical protein
VHRANEFEIDQKVDSVIEIKKDWRVGANCICCSIGKRAPEKRQQIFNSIG